MTRGGDRRSKPTAIRLLEGNPGKRPINHAEPTPPPIDLTCPAGLDAYGRQAWRRTAPLLADMGVLTQADADVLALYCDAYSQWRRSSAALRRLKPIDDAYRRVAITVEKARDQMRLLAGEFGMTPSSRVRIKVEPKQEASAFDELFGTG